MTFDGTEKIIGRGAQAEVFLYHGFAYKVYKPTYPAEWIEFEKHQQQEINKAGLCPVKYYDTDDPHFIKMDFVDGEMLETKINRCIQEKPGEISEIIEGYKLLGRAFNFVHKAEIQGLEIPHLRDTATMGLKESGMSDDEVQKLLSIIDRLSAKMKECVCHLDMHFLNIMLPHEKTLCAKTEYTIIDWMNARIAPAVFDYARTYVILDEFSKEALEVYKQVILPDVWASGASKEDFTDAVEVCTAIRKHEKGEKNV